MRDTYYFIRYFTILTYRIKGIGLGRLCEMVRRHAARNADPKPFLVNDFRGHAKLNCYLREHMGGQIFFRGSYSGDQLTLLERLLKPDGIFIDAGANQGEFSIAAASIVSKGKVISFEPVAEYRQRLKANIDLNGFNNIQVMPFALGECEGEMPIYDQEKKFSDGSRHEGLSTLFISESRGKVREVVTVSRLDDVLTKMAVTHVDIIKLDIEGAEWIALRGATKTLARYRPTLILEIGRETCLAAGYEPEVFARWIIEQGYRIEKIMDGGKTQPIITLKKWPIFQNIVAYPIDHH